MQLQLQDKTGKIKLRQVGSKYFSPSSCQSAFGLIGNNLSHQQPDPALPGDPTGFTVVPHGDGLGYGGHSTAAGLQREDNSYSSSKNLRLCP